METPGSMTRIMTVHDATEQRSRPREQRIEELVPGHQRLLGRLLEVGSEKRFTGMSLTSDALTTFMGNK